MRNFPFGPLPLGRLATRHQRGDRRAARVERLHCSEAGWVEGVVDRAVPRRQRIVHGNWRGAPATAQQASSARPASSSWVPPPRPRADPLCHAGRRSRPARRGRAPDGGPLAAVAFVLVILGRDRVPCPGDRGAPPAALRRRRRPLRVAVIGTGASAVELQAELRAVPSTRSWSRCDRRGAGASRRRSARWPTLGGSWMRTRSISCSSTHRSDERRRSRP